MSEYEIKQNLCDQLVTEYIETKTEEAKAFAVLALKEFEEWKETHHIGE